jgi:methionyl-tRNA formyltransferase
VPSLLALTRVAEVVGVVTQPDRPAGRGLQLHEPAVKVKARELGLLVNQPKKVRTGELAAWLRELQPDVGVVIAYGRILPSDVLTAPRLGCLNLHASLLPRYRGAAPIQWSIIEGEKETGISLMQMDEGLDTGPVYSRHSLALAADETTGSLTERLADLAARVVESDLPRVLRTELTAVAQDAALATHAPPIEREHTLVDWKRPARAIARQVRGLAPRPGAITSLGGKQLRLTQAAPSLAPFSLEPGVVGVDGGRIWVGTGEGTLELLSGQLEGKRDLPARDLVNGRVLVAGRRLGE